MHFLLVQNCATESLGRYQSQLAARGHTFTGVPAFDGTVLPRDKFDGVLVAGTPICALDTDEHPFLSAERSYLECALRAGLPYLGVCFGGQLLSLMLGGNVHRGANTEIGAHEIELTQAGRQDVLFDGFPTRFSAFQWHSDTFVPPRSAELLAVGADGTPQAFRRGTAVGLQFHLEVSHHEVQLWATEYESELAPLGMTKQQVIEECRRIDDKTDALASKLLENFTGLVERSAATHPHQWNTHAE